MSQSLMSPIAESIRAGFESSVTKTKEFKDFSKKFKVAIEKTLKENGAALVKFDVGHFELGGFYTIGGKIGQFSILDVRDYMFGDIEIMYRKTTAVKSGVSGSNNWCNIESDSLGRRMIAI